MIEDLLIIVFHFVLKIEFHDIFSPDQICSLMGWPYTRCVCHAPRAFGGVSKDESSRLVQSTPKTKQKKQKVNAIKQQSYNATLSKVSWLLGIDPREVGHRSFQDDHFRS